MSKKSAPERITLPFDLHDLPTAQHRAGLAGLILQIDSMGADGHKRDPKLIPSIDRLTATTATITFTPESMQGVFDEVYAAEVVETIVEKKRQGKVKAKPGAYFIEKRDSRTGEIRRIPGFAYDDVQPMATCLSRHLQPEARAWLSLWRRMIWEIPRGGNNVNSRAPFNERAKGNPCAIGALAWKQACDFHHSKSSNFLRTEKISGALLLGAQAVNAEIVPFSGRVDHNLLLHFWQVVVLPFVPRRVNKKEKKTKRYGYVLAIPDVADLVGFHKEFPRMLGSLRADPSKTLPADAQIDLPDQANLEVLRQLKGLEGPERDARSIGRALHRDGQGPSSRGHMQALATDKAIAEFGSGGIRAVESYHMVKQGNNIKLVSFVRVADRPGLTEEYGRIEGSYRNPLFRAVLMRALIRGEPWLAGMIELFTEYPWPFFIEGDDTPKYLARFGRDANDQLRAIIKDYEDMRDMRCEEPSDEDRLKHLTVIIRKVVDRYVVGRAEAKTRMKVDSFPKRKVEGRDRPYPVYPKEFLEAHQRVCSDAFLSMRSRHDQDFVDYFAGSICSVAPPAKVEDLQFLIEILMTKPDANPLARKVPLSWEDVKAIAMIAVSACSYRVRPREPQTQGSPP